jgi:hypothetical protein
MYTQLPLASVSATQVEVSEKVVTLFGTPFYESN